MKTQWRWRGEFEPGVGAIDQREHGDRRGGLAFGLFDAGKFAVNFRAHRFVAQKQFLSAPARRA